ncbi:hypothetical protein [Geosporobacter subterraneus]|uniref:hypothetical protein n=1 Tax=Geosporobacter subterraneus TaxID=390806 RepID=UPI000DA62707|nr:hypothetical protein [Geosporobacter subterraneus]
MPVKESCYLFIIFRHKLYSDDRLVVIADFVMGLSFLNGQAVGLIIGSNGCENMRESLTKYEIMEGILKIRAK